jgi:dipeptidyl aminopeptidase/acylaminoacyl peptidase
MSLRNTNGTVLFTLLTAFALTLGSIITHNANVVIKTGLLIADVLPLGPANPLELMTSPPIHEQVRYPAGPTEIMADIYRPQDADRHAAIIFVPGVTTDFDARPLVQVGTSVARLGIVVMIPHLNGMQRSRLTPEDVDAVVAGFQYLQEQAFVDEIRIGLAGFCVGSSIALVAAEDPRINEQVALVSTFGGYYDLMDYFVAIATSRTTYNGQEQPWYPSMLTLSAYTGHILDALDNPADQDILLQTAIDGDLKAEAVPPGLSPLGRIAYGLLTTQDPEKVKALIEQIPAEKLENLLRVSPSRGIHRLKAPVFIMYDREDTGAPYTESLKLADNLPEEQRTYSEFTIFEHVYPTKPTNTLSFAREVVKLYLHLYRVVEQLQP